MKSSQRRYCCESIFQAVVNQTIAGLAAGRKLKETLRFLVVPYSLCLNCANDLLRP